MRINLYTILAFVFVMFSCKDDEKQIDDSISTSISISISASEEEWIDLFNGKDLSGWDVKISKRELGDNYNNTFRVEDSMISVSYDEYESFGDHFGHLYYEKPYSYYKLKLDYRFTGEQAEGGASWANRNSGVMLHSQSAESNSLGQFFPISIEFQFLGGLSEGDRPTGNLCTPGTAVTMNDSIFYPHCVNSSSKTYNGDRWVSVEAVVMGDEKIIHIVEGDTVMQYTKPIIGGGMISRGNDEEWKANGIDNQDDWLARQGEELTEGYIALQAESSPVDFKNVKLLDLCGCMDKKAKNYKTYYVKADNKKCIYN